MILISFEVAQAPISFCNLSSEINPTVRPICFLRRYQQNNEAALEKVYINKFLLFSNDWYLSFRRTVSVTQIKLIEYA